MALPCRLVLAALAIAAPSWCHASLLVNGGFEAPDIGGSGVADYFLTIHPGQEGNTGFAGWTVDLGNVDVVDVPDLKNSFPNAVLTAFEGDQVLDLHGTHHGLLHQDFSTVAGQLYRLTFAYNSNEFNAPATDTATVSATDVGTGANLFTPYQISHVHQAPWETGLNDFVATGTTSRLTFRAPSPGASSFGGIILDAVRVRTIPAPATGMTLMLTLGLTARRRFGR